MILARALRDSHPPFASATSRRRSPRSREETTDDRRPDRLAGHAGGAQSRRSSRLRRAKATRDTSRRAERIAVFDNDGTLWTEKPLPVQLDFIFRMVAAAAEPSAARSTSRTRPRREGLPLAGRAMVKHYGGDDADMGLLIGGLSKRVRGVGGRGVRGRGPRVVRDRSTRAAPAVPDVRVRPDDRAAALPRGQRLHDLHRLRRRSRLHAAVRRDVYGIPPERIIGASGLGTEYPDADGSLYKPQIEFFDDGPTKPVRIWSRSAAPASGRRQLQRRHRDAPLRPGRRDGLRSCCVTTTPSARSTTRAGPTRSSARGPRRSACARTGTSCSRPRRVRA